MKTCPQCGATHDDSDLSCQCFYEFPSVAQKSEDREVSTKSTGNRIGDSTVSKDKSTTVAKSRTSMWILVALLAVSLLALLNELNYRHKEFFDSFAMSEAVDSGNSQAVSSLIEKPLDPGSALAGLFTPEQFFPDLLNREDRKSETTPLHLAAGKGYTEIVKIFLDHRVRPNLRDLKGDTPLADAVIFQKKEAAELLLERGADVTLSSKPILTLAIDTGNVSIVKMLIDRGADVNARSTCASGDSCTPFCRAAVSTKAIELRPLMFSKGADVNQKCFGGFGAIYSMTDVEAVKLLLNARAYVLPNQLYLQCSRPEILRLLYLRLPPSELPRANLELNLACPKPQ